jgi:hypothetical protein
MATVITEEMIINKLATHVGAISGIQNAYTFGNNPDSLPNSSIPAQVFYPMQSDYTEGGHHNIWSNTVRIRGSLFVVSRTAKGGKMSFLENDALVFPQLFRQKFQTSTVINDFLGLGMQRFLMESIKYGAGGLFLTYMGKEYIGFVIDWLCFWKAGGANS